MLIKKLNFPLIACTAFLISGCASTPSSKLVSNPDQYPIYPGCELVAESQRIICFSKKVQKFFQRKFNTDIASDNGLVGKLRSRMTFIVNANGQIKQIDVNSPHPALETEIVRVINDMPVLTAGVDDGETVAVPFSIPFVFSIH